MRHDDHLGCTLHHHCRIHDHRHRGLAVQDDDNLCCTRSTIVESTAVTAVRVSIAVVKSPDHHCTGSNYRSCGLAIQDGVRCMTHSRGGLLAAIPGLRPCFRRCCCGGVRWSKLQENDSFWQTLCLHKGVQAETAESLISDLQAGRDLGDAQYCAGQQYCTGQTGRASRSFVHIVSGCASEDCRITWSPSVEEPTATKAGLPHQNHGCHHYLDGKQALE